MRLLYILSVYLIYNFCLAQHKAFTPKSGEIVFVKQESAEDKARYIEVGELLKNQITDKSNQIGKAVDTTAINQKLKEISKTVDTAINKEEKWHHTFKGEEIVGYKSADGNKSDIYRIINTKTGSSSMFAKNDSVTIHLGDHPYYTPYKKGTSLKIEENPKDTKKIYGFNCFKIIVIVRTHIDENDLSSMEITTKYEMWVTDKIKCLYHPIIRLKEVLEKYYPLEIIETSDMLMGKTLYTLSSLTLK